MKFKAGDRVHVKRLDWEDVNFYATLEETATDGVFSLIDCSLKEYSDRAVIAPHRGGFGNEDYYTLATDEEDTEEPEVQHIKRENKIELDNHYIIKMKKDSYVQVVTSNYYFRFTENIKRANVYEDKSDAIEHAELIGGRVLNLKRYVEVE